MDEQGGGRGPRSPGVGTEPVEERKKGMFWAAEGERSHDSLTRKEALKGRRQKGRGAILNNRQGKGEKREAHFIGNRF